jgi:transcriptional regulator with XRE-family HTH domain
MSDYKEVFSRNLRFYMDRNNKSQVDLITDLGFNKSSVSTWVNGSRLPRMDKVDVLAEYLHCTRSDLIEEHELDENQYYLSKETQRITNFLSKNPGHRVLFDASMKVSAKDVEKVAKMLGIFGEDNG